MSKCSKGLFSALIFAAAIGCSSMVLGQINLVSPEVEVIEGDEQVEIFWSDPEPEELVYIRQPVLGTVAFRWSGNAELSSEGFYLGACDWTFNVLVSLVIDTWELSWREVIDWKTGAQVNRRVDITDLGTYYDLSDGIRVKVDAIVAIDTVAIDPVKVDTVRIFDTDLTGWSGPRPQPGGLFWGGDASYPDSVVLFTFTCTQGGELGVAGGDIRFDWVSTQRRPAELGDSVQSGSFTVDQADSPGEVHRGMNLTFPAGTFASGETFSVDLLIPLVDGDRLSVVAETFEGYLVLRRSIAERPDQFTVISNISKCDSFELFQDTQGFPAPDGERYYIDTGVYADQPYIDYDPDKITVLNGFPYDYAVATYDVSAGHEQVLSPIDTVRVYPSGPPASSADDVYVVPNPYVREAGWDLDGAKLRFINVPEGTVIRIYDASGGYVDTIYPNRYSYDPSKQQGSVDWDLKNADGTKVASGIYIYKVESDRGGQTGRFIIVR